MDEKFKNELKQKLDAEAYRVIVEKGTELPNSGEYNRHFQAGSYHCKACGHKLFDADAKFESGCGWPSFDREIPGADIERIRDTSHGMIRTEIVCGHCDGHLGHVFDDGPTTTGERYCVNSVSLEFRPS